MNFSARPTKDDVDAFVEYLYGRGWVHAVILTCQLNINRRHLRALAEASKGRVISGNKGYHVTAEATQAEVASCCDRIRSQGHRMLARANAALRVWDEVDSKVPQPF